MVARVDSGEAEHPFQSRLCAPAGQSKPSILLGNIVLHPNEPFNGSAARTFWQLIRENRRHTRSTATEHLHLRAKPSRTLISVLLNLAQETHVPLLSILLNPIEASAIRPLIDDQPEHIPHKRRRKMPPNERTAGTPPLS